MAAEQKRPSEIVERWEYRWHRMIYEPRRADEILGTLNALGAEGWEITGFSGQSGALFKRRLPPHSGATEEGSDV